MCGCVYVWVCVCGCVCVGVCVWVCVGVGVCEWVLQCVDVSVICLLVFTVFCIVSFTYIYSLYAFV